MPKPYANAVNASNYSIIQSQGVEIEIVRSRLVNFKSKPRATLRVTPDPRFRLAQVELEDMDRPHTGNEVNITHFETSVNWGRRWAALETSMS